ncbi:hypothetical protein PM082_011840 [Marasmius tenuissimus]|nr:hypothetical protein PM082_011840 [Marasmius tenuissimus]
MLLSLQIRSFSALLLLLNAVYAQEAAISCEAAARRVGQPVDGWKTVKTFERTPSGKKRVKSETCVREETREAHCCQKDGSVTWQDEEAKLGFVSQMLLQSKHKDSRFTSIISSQCCAPGHHWSGDISTGEGGCCPLETVMVDGRCVEKPPTSSCGCHSKVASDPGDDEEAVDTADWQDKVAKKASLASTSADTPLGINYGTCYTLSLADGTPIGSNRENSIYTPDGLFQGIPFRVCRSTDSCDGSGQIWSTDPFYLQDRMGRFNDPEGKPGWVAESKRGKLRIKFSWDEEEAQEFYAERGESCGNEDCLKLDEVPLELVLSETDCSPWNDDALPKLVEQV